MEFIQIVNRNHEISCLEDRCREISARRKKKKGVFHVPKMRNLRSKP